MTPDERYRRDAQAYGPEIARQLRDKLLEPDTAGRLQADADGLEDRYHRAGVGRMRGTGRNFDEAAADFLRQHDAGLAAADASRAPDLCLNCGAYWACDCPPAPHETIAQATELWGKPIRLVDGIPPIPNLETFETIAGEKFTIDTSDRP